MGRKRNLLFMSKSDRETTVLQPKALLTGIQLGVLLDLRYETFIRPF